MIDGHGVPLRLSSHEKYVHGILTEIEVGHPVSQRSLATNLGIALGLTNLLVRRVIRKGWVRAVRIKPNRVRYLLTPSGLAEKARMSSVFLQHSIQFYADARDRVRERLAEASRQLSVTDGTAIRRIVFYGADEVAEIAYVCLQETDLTLVGVVGEGRARFFGLPVQPSSELREDRLGDTPFDHLVVASFVDADGVRARLASLGVAKEKVLWL